MMKQYFPNLQLIENKENSGFPKGNNIGVAAAKGEYILLLNSDTVVLDRAVDRLMTFAHATPQAGIWGGRTVFGDGRLNIGSAWGRQTVWSAFCFASGLSLLFSRLTLFDPEAMRGWDRGSEREVDIVSGCFLLIDRPLWDDLGGFDQAFFMYAEEADLCLRARARGARPRVSPAATIVHYGGASATSNTQAVRRVIRAKVALARKHNCLTCHGIDTKRLSEVAAMAIKDPSAGGNPIQFTEKQYKALARKCVTGDL